MADYVNIQCPYTFVFPSNPNTDVVMRIITFQATQLVPPPQFPPPPINATGTGAQSDQLLKKINGVYIYNKDLPLDGTIPAGGSVQCTLTVGLNPSDINVNNSNLFPQSINVYIQFSNGPFLLGGPAQSVQVMITLLNQGTFLSGYCRYTGTTSIPISIFCLLENTRVLTDKGYVNVQDLKNNDIVVTHDNRYVSIKSVICMPTISSPNTDPFLYKANCFSENYPPIDTYLSPHHAILINDKWDVKGRADKDLWTHGAHLKYNNLLNDNIKQVKIADSFNYYHIYLPDFGKDHLVINDGLVVESYGSDYHITHKHHPEDPRVFTVELEKKQLDI